jgi:hypothetical protein
VLLIGWLLWKVWNGARRARCLMAGLFLTIAMIAAVVGGDTSVALEWPHFLALAISSLIVWLEFGLGLASPWVDAY